LLDFEQFLCNANGTENKETRNEAESVNWVERINVRARAS
jgi:hypothetical protein